MRVLIVCLGNICRSPIAEGVLRHKAKQHGLNWVVESAGTESYHIGEAPHRYSQKICLAHGLDISGLRAKRFTRDDFEKYDKIYAMAADVYREIRQIGGRHADMNKTDYFLNELYRRKVTVNELSFGVSDLEFAKDVSVPDPYYGTEAGYKIVYDLIEQTCDAIISNYKKEIYV